MTELLLLSWFSMERKSLCFEECFKDPPRHMQYLFRREKKPITKTKQQQMYLRYRQEVLPMPPWLSADGGI